MGNVYQFMAALAALLLTTLPAMPAPDCGEATATQPSTQPESRAASGLVVPASAPSPFRYQPGREAKEAAEAVGLTEKQWQVVRRRIEELADKQARWLAGEEQKVRALGEQVRQARKTKDRARIRQLEIQLRPLLAERASIFVNELDVLMSVFTEKQKVSLEAWRLLRTVMRKYEQAHMTDEQEAKAKQMCLASAARRLAASTWREKNNIRKELLRAIEQDLLTEQQRIAQEAYELNRSATWFFKPAELTGEQKAAIYKISKTVAAERIKTEDWREQAKLRRQVLKTVYQEILTDQQRLRSRDPAPSRPSTGPSPATSPHGFDRQSDGIAP